MRKKVVILTIALTTVLLAGAYFLSHRAKVSTAVAQAPTVRAKTSTLPRQTVIVPARSSERTRTDLAFPDSHQKDVRFRTILMILDVTADVLSRQKALRALPRDLSPDSRKPFMAFLATVHAEDAGQAGHVLKNDMMDLLVGQTIPDRGLAQLFISLYQDKAQNGVIRDYALQHLTLLSERLDTAIQWEASLVQTQQKLIQDTLWQVAEGRDSSMAGTALAGLTQIAQMHIEVDRIRLGQAAVAMTDAGIDEAARVTAFQICARLQVSSALPLAVQAAQTDSSSIVRTSAIGALGLFGSVDDIAILDQIAQKNPRLRPVATIAMRRIQKRTQ